MADGTAGDVTEEMDPNEPVCVASTLISLS